MIWWSIRIKYFPEGKIEMNVVITIRKGGGVGKKKYQGTKINETFRTNSIRTNSFLAGRTFQKIRKHGAIYTISRLYFQKITSEARSFNATTVTHVRRWIFRTRHNGGRSGNEINTRFIPVEQYRWPVVFIANIFFRCSRRGSILETTEEFSNFLLESMIECPFLFPFSFFHRISTLVSPQKCLPPREEKFDRE